MLQIHQLGAGIGAAALAASLAAFARWTLKVDNVEDAVRQLQLGIDKYHGIPIKTILLNIDFNLTSNITVLHGKKKQNLTADSQRIFEAIPPREVAAELRKWLLGSGSRPGSRSECSE